MSLIRIKYGTRWFEVESLVSVFAMEPGLWSEKPNFRHIMITPKNVYPGTVPYLSEKGSVQSESLVFYYFLHPFFTICRYVTKSDSLYQGTGTGFFSVFGHFGCTRVSISSVSSDLLCGSILIISFLFSEPTLQWLSDTLETFLVSRQTTLWCPSAMSKCGKWCFYFSN